MTMLLITLFVVGATTYLWVTRGFMSALIHMVCVLVAGAIAFGIWEPVSIFLLNLAPARGPAAALGGLAWGLGLALPFAIVLALLRVSVDAVLPANAQCDPVVDYIGGGLCGFVSGVISAGIIVLSIGFLRVHPEFWGHNPLQFTTQASRGSLERPATRFVPWVDRLTVSLYSQLSTTTLRTDRPLGVWHPDFDTFPASLRHTYDGASRNTLKPDDFRVLSWYTVGDPQRPSSLDPLLVDRWSSTRQRITDIDGQPITQGHLAGFIVQLQAGARETGGYISVGNAQVRLVVRREGSDDAQSIHPIAVVTRSADPSQIEYARFRFDSDGFYVASIGGEADALMGFEFPIPAGYQPIALYVKGVRYTLLGKQPGKNFPTVEDRDQIIIAGQFEGMKEVGAILGEDGLPIQRVETQAHTGDPVVINNALPFVITKGTERSLSVAQVGRGWVIEDGEGTYSRREIEGGWGTPFNLQINRFGVTPDTTMVRVDVTPAHRSQEFIQAFDSADPNTAPELVDSNGRRYQAVGFIFDDGTNYQIRYTRGQPMRSLAEFPAVSRNNPDRKLSMLFIVSRGVDLSEFRIGRTIVERYSPPLSTDLGQR